MSKKKYLWSRNIAAVSMAGVVLAGCSGDEAESEDDTVTISTVRTLDDGTVFKDGEDVNDNVHTQWAEEELGIDFDYLWTRPNDEQYNQQIRLGMSANEPLPDVFQVTDEQMVADLIESGRVMPIDDAIEEHASDRLKELFDEYEEAFYPSTRDGERYGVPRFSGGNGSEPLLWVRQDWLDKFDLEAPETIEELEEAMEIFVNEDPNETGEDDTFGMTLSGGEVGFTQTNMGDTSFLFGAYGDTLPFRWTEDDNGELEYGSIQPNAKEALQKLHDWREAGYISTQIGTQPEDQAQESFISGRSGFMTAPPWGWDYPIGDLFSNVPDAEVQPYPLPVNENGQGGRKAEALMTGTFLFSADFEHMDRYFEYLDEIYGYTFGESEYFEDGLYESYDYAYDEDGEPVYSPEEVEEITGEQRVDPGRYFLPTNAPAIPFEMYSILEEFHETDREGEFAYEVELSQRDEEYIEAAAIVNQQNDLRIEDAFTGPPTETMRDRWENLERLEMEMYADIIYGNEPVEAFDEFVDVWRESGGDQVTEEVNQWYEDAQVEE